MSDLIERMYEASRNQSHNPPLYYEAAGALEQQAGEIERLKAENFSLAAGQCANLTGDEGGTPICAEIERLHTLYNGTRTSLQEAWDALTSLKAENAKLNLRLQHSRNDCRDAGNLIAELEAENAELRKDAERWRFFLSTRPPGTHEVIVEAIDAAMEGEK